MEEAVWRDVTLVRVGVAQTAGVTTRRARTGIGCSTGHRTLYTLTVDDNGSTGMTVNAFAPELVAFGIADGVNRAAGGSTTLWADAEGVVNRPTPGSQRVVAHYLGVRVEGGAQGVQLRRLM
jgi:hypothetical protein